MSKADKVTLSTAKQMERGQIGVIQLPYSFRIGLQNLLCQEYVRFCSGWYKTPARCVQNKAAFAIQASSISASASTKSNTKLGEGLNIKAMNECISLVISQFECKIFQSAVDKLIDGHLE